MAHAVFLTSRHARARLFLFSSIAGLAILLNACSGRILPHATAPARYRVELDTSRGPIEIEVTRAEAPLGADRFYNLVKSGYFQGARFFRVVPGFVIQFGLAADPAVTKEWQKPITDDPARTSNLRGTLAFAVTSAPNSRTTQLFINLGDNRRLDQMGFAHLARIVRGMETVDRIYSEYGENPDQSLIEAQGNAYLTKAFPLLDYIRTARIAP